METIKTPSRLENSPLVDAIFELRFRPKSPAVEDLLPGFLFLKFAGRYPTVTPLPLSSVPKEARERDPNLKFRPTHRMAGSGSTVQTGQRVLALSSGTSYPGWSKFSAEIRDLLSFLFDTGLVDAVERFALRYINIVKVPEGNRLSQLDLQLAIRSQPISEEGMHLRVEYHQDEYVSILQIAPTAEATFPDGSKVSGLLIDVDTARPVEKIDFWSTSPELLEVTHRRTKEVFFSVLTAASLESLKPHWEE